MKKIMTFLLCGIMALSPVFSTPIYAAETQVEGSAAAEYVEETAQEEAVPEESAQEETNYVAETAETEETSVSAAEAETEALETEVLETETEAAATEALETEGLVSDSETAGISEKAQKNVGDSVQALRGASQGIANNGSGGIWIDINSSPYSDAWATDIAYGPSGCTWFVASRVKELTGKSNYPTVYGCRQWWEWYGESLGFTKGTATPTCKAVIVYYNDANTLMHVAILEKIEGDTAYISEGGRNVADMAQHGYTTIRSMSVADLTNGVGFQNCGSFVGYVYMNECPFDREPPTFHGKAKAVPVKPNGVQFVFEASDNIGITSYTIKVWKYGQNESQAVDFTNRVQEFSYDGSKFYSVRMSTSDFDGFLGPYHVACYVYDAAGNQAISFAKDSISFYECKPGNRVTGTYKVSADTAPERCAPYASVNGEDTKIATRKKGEKISVVGAYTNNLGNLWYQTSAGSWIYSENFEHYNWFMEQLDKLKNLFEKVVFYWCGMAVQKEAALDAASQLSAAMTTSNYALLDVSIIRRVAEEAANAFSYSTITFDPNGGSCGMGQITYVTGSAFGSLPGAYRFGYTFDGWFTAPEDGSIVTADSICSGSQTLYAHWTRIILLEGECGPNLHFVLYGDGILEVTGTGEMTSHPWTTNFAGRVLEVQLPEELTGICADAFRNCTYLEIINIPELVSEIKSGTFYKCTYLDNIVLPEAVSAIGAEAFYQCESLKKIVIPDKVTTLKRRTFEGCISLSDVTLSNNLVSMAEWVFSNDTALTSIVIPKSLDYCDYNTIDAGAQGPFYQCSNLKNVTFEEGTTIIPAGVFAACTGLEKIVIPDTVTELEKYCFANCSNLKDVTIGNSVKEIGSDSFYATALTSIVIPDSVTDLYRSVFAKCTNLAEVTLSKNLKHMAEWVFSNDTALTSIVIPKSLDYCDYYTNDAGAQGPFYQCSNLKNVTFEEGTTIIPAGVFAACTGIEEIVIPDTATEIEKYSFANCPNLKNVTIGNSVKEIGSNSFYGAAITSIVIPDSVTDLYRSVFANCTNLAEVKLSKNLKHMAEWVFSNDTALTSIVIPKNLDYCDYYTNGAGAQGPFYHCNNLKNVTFEEGITIIPAGVFAACAGIEEIVIPDTVVELEKYCFANCDNLSKVTMSSQVQEIGTASFYNGVKITEITLPETMIALYGPCFYHTGITQIRIPGGITSIPDEAFRSCFALEQIDWSHADSLKTIGANAFRDCTRLKEAEIPLGVTTVNSYAFYNCNAITKAVVPDSVTTLASYAFAECDTLSDVSLGKGLTTLASSLFEGCGVLTSLIVPYRVTTIGANAFKNTPQFTSITIPKSVTSISTSAFSYPQNLTIYGVSGSYTETFAEDNDITFIVHEVHASKVSLSETNIELLKNGSKTLYLTVEPEDFTDDIVWKSTNTAVATVTDVGLVKGVSAGTAVIKVSVGDTTVTCNVTVLQPVTGISLSKTSAAIELGDTLQLTATVNPSSANNKTLLWSSSDESIASVDDNGLITANAVGTATITAAATDGSGVKATCKITVQKTKTICETVDELESAHPYANKSDFQWVYTLAGAENLLVTFDERTATEEGCDYIYIYDKDGNQVGSYSGTELAGKTITVPGDTVTIRLTADSSVNDWGFKVISVEAAGEPGPSTIPATGIYFLNNSGEWPTGNSFILAAHIEPENANDFTLTWSSSNTKVATVENGVVTVNVYGTAIITAKLVSAGKTMTVSYEVKALFNDVTNKSKYWFTPVYWAADHEPTITNGYEGGVYFGPELNCTREDLITFLYREAGKPAVTAAQIKKYNTFYDVPSGKYYEKPIVWAAMNGITKGYSDGSFGVGKSITREDTVTFLYRMAKAVAGNKFKDVTATDLKNKEYTFSDVISGKYYQKPIVWAAKNGITKGYSSGEHKGKFGVGFNVLRGDIVTFLYRYDGKFN